jgi:ComF family protein
MIHRLKFGGSRIDARVLGGLLADRIRDVYRFEALPQLILPVPLSSTRLFRRGHNQAALLARWVGSTLDLRVDYQCCRRIRNTPPQAGLRRRARLHNLSGAFDVRGNLLVRHVAILDDVMTTGSTAAALTRTLVAAGAERVDVWTAARTLERNASPGSREFGGTAPALVLLE